MGMVGLGDSAMTAAAPSAPPASISPYAAPACGWGQKLVGNGPFTCQFDISTALAEAWEAPGIYVGMLLAKTVPSAANSINPSFVSAVFYGGLAWLIYSTTKVGKK